MCGCVPKHNMGSEEEKHPSTCKTDCQAVKRYQSGDITRSFSNIGMRGYVVWRLDIDEGNTRNVLYFGISSKIFIFWYVAASVTILVLEPSDVGRNV